MNTYFKNAPRELVKYLDYLAGVKNYSIKTVKLYYEELMAFFKYIKEYNNIEIEVEEFNFFIFASVKRKDIISYLVYLDYTKENKPNTRQRKLYIIRGFYKWLYFTDNPPVKGLVNPAEDIENIRQIVRVPKHLSLEQGKKIQKIFTKENSKFPLRNNTIIKFVLNTGVRVGELVSINISDINTDSRTLIVNGKGNKERTIYINEATMKEVKKYLKERNQKEKIINFNAPLFTNYKGERLSERSVEVICRKAYSLMGLDNMGYCVHTLRHTFATVMYEHTGQDINLVKELLGHSSIKTTEIYISSYDKNVKEAVNRNPLSNFESKKVA